ncbi:zinc carboxypeptidase [Streptococcus hongkongensis]|nr:zinc carboxypeptidase [Streptococcus uberis]
MTNLKTGHKASSDILIKGLSASCLLLCSLALTQYVQANEVIATDSAGQASALVSNDLATGSTVPVASSDTNLATSTSPTTSVTAPAIGTETPTVAPTDTSKPSSNGDSILASAITSSTAVPLSQGSQTVYMEEKNTVAISAPTTSPMTWTISNLPTKTYDIKSGGFVGADLLSVTSVTNASTTDYHITINPLFGSDLSLRWPNNIRRTYRDYIGTYTLTGVSQDGQTILTKELNLRPYADYMTHDELLNELKTIEQNHATDRLVRIETIGKSALKNDIKMGIVAKDQATIDNYLNQTTPLMLMQPDKALELLAQGKFDYQLPILINNTHADEQPGIDIVRSLFKTFATASIINYQTVDANNNPKTVTIDIKRLLEKVILLFNFTENPDGDIANERALNNGLDPNRDTGYQTNPETIAIVEQINKWNPISIFDVHGFVKDFLIEPCTPPHDPNFEYDLFENDLVNAAREMGNAGITNSVYDRYIIPKFDYGSGWDDSFSGYTAVYGLYQGILGHTIEIPGTNQESYKAGYHAVLGGINYDLSHSDQLMKNRLNFYLRGIQKAEVKAAEDALVTVDGSVKGRIKDGHATFFPDYYVIPMELSATNDIDQAFKMIDYFRRNGVIINELTADAEGYKKGDLVIDMAQAKRGYANHVLYKGANESEWSAMYAELVMNFPAMRGFRSEAVYKASVFDGKLGGVTLTSAPRTQSTTENYYIVSNNSLAAVQAVNAAIKAGKSVYLTDDGYVMDKATYDSVVATYPLYAKPTCLKPIGQTLKALAVYAPGNANANLGFRSPSEVSLALKQMGFNLVDSASDADVIVLDNDQFDASILGKKPIIVLGGVAMAKLESLGVLPGFDAAMTDPDNGYSYEGLMKITLDANSPYTSGYAANSLYYANSGSWIEAVPSGFKTLANISESNFYVSGWWPKHERLANKTVAISGMFQGQPMFIFAGNPTNKTHTINFYRWVSNAIFGTNLTEFVEGDCHITVPDNNKVITINHNGQTIYVYQQGSTNPVATTEELPKLADSKSKSVSNSFVVTGLLVASAGLFASVKRRKEN